MLKNTTERVFNALKNGVFPIIREFETAPLNQRRERIFGLLSLKECNFGEGESLLPAYRISLLGDSSVGSGELYGALLELLEGGLFPEIPEIKSVKINPLALSKALSRTELSADIILSVKSEKILFGERPQIILSENVIVSVEEYSAERARNRGQTLVSRGKALLWDGGERALSCSVAGTLKSPVDWAFLDDSVKTGRKFSFTVEGLSFPEMILVSYSAEKKARAEFPRCKLEFLSESGEGINV